MAERTDPERRGLLFGALHLGALWALGVAQPMLDLLGRNPEFFVARGNTRLEIVGLALAIALAPPLAMLAIEAIAERIRPALRDLLHLALVGLLTAVIAVQILDDVSGGPGAVLVAISVALGAGGAFLYARQELVPQALTVLSPVPLVFVAMFLFISDARKLVLPADEAEAAAITVPGSTPVVVLLFDEFPATSLMGSEGEIDRALFPNFAELADQGIWYPNATTEADLTPRAAPAVMTGSYPGQDQLPRAEEHPDSIFTLLGGSYRLNVSEPLTSVCPEGLCGGEARPAASERIDSLISDLGVVYAHLVLPESLRDGLPAVDQSFGDFGAGPEEGAGQADAAEEEAAAEARGGLEPEGQTAGGEIGRRSEKQAGRATKGFSIGHSSFKERSAELGGWLEGLEREGLALHFAHLELPHVPWTYYPNGQRYPSGLLERDGLRDVKGRNPEQDYLITLLQQRHLLQVGYVDRILGHVIQTLKRQKLWDRAIVVAAADHGVSFEPGQPRRVPNRSNFAEIATVPLLVKPPGKPLGRVDERPARTVDIVPTIADLLGITMPYETEGVSLFRELPPRARVAVEDRYGRRLDIPFAEFVRERERLIFEKLARFGGRGGWERIFRVAPHEELIGRRVDSLPRERGADRSEFWEPHRWNAVEPSGVLVPSSVRATISELEPGVPVAVAINGRIQAMAESYPVDEETRIFAVAPPWSLRPGRNSVEIFSVVEASPIRLTSLGGVNLAAAP